MNMSTRITNEQPVSKRQRIDTADANNKKDVGAHRAFGAITNGSYDKPHHNNASDLQTPPDILPAHETISTTTAVPIASATPATATAPAATSTTIADDGSDMSEATGDDVDHAVAAAPPFGMNEKTGPWPQPHNHCLPEYPDLLKGSADAMKATKRRDEMAAATSHRSPASRPSSSSPSPSSSSTSSKSSSCASPPISTMTHPVPGGSSNSSSSSSSSGGTTNSACPSTAAVDATTATTIPRLSVADNNGGFSDSNTVDDFQSHLMKQCLCHISKESLLRAFTLQYHIDINGAKHPVVLAHWRVDKLIQFLSNFELLFETYLNQNAKGEICTRVMQVCDKLLLHEQNIIDDIFELNEHRDPFVRYLAIKVLANCMLISKDKDDYSENLKATLIASLCTDYEPTNRLALDKVAFALGIMLHIMEWKDIRKHPLDDQIVINGREVYNDSDNENFSIPMEVPPIQLNPFAVQLPGDGVDLHAHGTDPSDGALAEHRMDDAPMGVPRRPGTCHLQYLSDSESFDSKELKFSLTISLRRKWPHLVKDMRACIAELQRNRSLHYIENTVMTFLNVWERIINVDTCISFESTLPFHESLVPFVTILVKGNLPVQVYKQILTLFSASLCYTTTLALQNEVPEETNRLAIEIFNHVKTSTMFASLPANEPNERTDTGFIGRSCESVEYASCDAAAVPNGDRTDEDADHTDDDDDDDDSDDDDEADERENGDDPAAIDAILLQKLVLLILKAIVVTVRPIRSGDSSDSSMDSCSSTSSTADQDAQTIGRVTREVVKVLKEFLHKKLNHHPETHLSKVIVHLFNNQDDYLIEAMLCMLGTTITFLPRQAPFGSASRQSTAASASASTSSPSTSSAAGERSQFRELIDMISPVYTFLEFLELIHFDKQTMLDLLITDDTCFLLYFLRFLKYIRNDWPMFQSRCGDWLSSSNRTTVLADVMTVLIPLRMKLERLVKMRLFPYDINPLVSLMNQCESLYDGNEHELF